MTKDFRILKSISQDHKYNAYEANLNLIGTCIAQTNLFIEDNQFSSQTMES